MKTIRVYDSTSFLDKDYGFVKNLILRIKLWLAWRGLGSAINKTIKSKKHKIVGFGEIIKEKSM